MNGNWFWLEDDITTPRVGDTDGQVDETKGIAAFIVGLVGAAGWVIWIMAFQVAKTHGF